MTTKERPLRGFAHTPDEQMTNEQLKLEVAIGHLQDAVRDEGLEATTVEHAIVMYAWDLGYQNQKIPDWLIYLGKQFKVPVKKEHAQGVKSAKE